MPSSDHFRVSVALGIRRGQHEAPRQGHLADIEADSRSRGVIDQDSVIALFPEHRRAGIDEMLQHWSKLRDVESGSGELDRAIDAKDKGAVKTATPRYFLFRS